MFLSCSLAGNHACRHGTEATDGKQWNFVLSNDFPEDNIMLMLNFPNKVLR
jgi:hypothetical protein